MSNTYILEGKIKRQLGKQLSYKISKMIDKEITYYIIKEEENRKIKIQKREEKINEIIKSSE